MNSPEQRHLQVGDACCVLAGRNKGAMVQVDELPDRNHRQTYKGRHWVAHDHAYTFFCMRAELEYIGPAS